MEAGAGGEGLRLRVRLGVRVHRLRVLWLYIYTAGNQPVGACGKAILSESHPSRPHGRSPETRGARLHVALVQRRRELGLRLLHTVQPSCCCLGGAVSGIYEGGGGLLPQHRESVRSVFGAGTKEEGSKGAR